jgi:tetratricopeptide (TPR) repeat protein
VLEVSADEEQIDPPPALPRSTTDPAPRPNDALATLSEKLSLLGWIALKIIVPVGILYGLIYFDYLVFAPTTYTLAPFKVAKDLEKAGYTGEVIRDLFLSKAEEIASIANSPVRRVDVLQSTTPTIDFQIPKTTFSFRSLADWARKARGASDVAVTVDLVKDGYAYGAYARVEDPKYFGRRAPLVSKGTSLDEVVAGIALQVLSRLDPVVGGSYKMSVSAKSCRASHNCKIDDFRDALEDLDAAETSDRHIHYRALIAIAHILETTGDYKTAISYLDRAISLDRKQLEAYEVKGVQQFALGLYSDAIATYDAIAEASPLVTTYDPNASFLQLDWANALVASDQKKDAIRHYQQSIRDWDGNAEAKAKLAYALYLDKQYNEALAAFQEALAIDPFQAEVHKDLANTIREFVVSLMADPLQSKFKDCKTNDHDPKHYPQFNDAVNEHIYSIQNANGDQHLLTWFHKDLSKTYAACGAKELAQSEFELAVKNDVGGELKECGWCK